MDIVYKDSDIIVVNKAAGVPVQTKSITQKDLESEIKKILVSEGIKNPYLAVINRLDQPVSGLVLFALNKNAAAKLSDDLVKGRIDKFYKAEIFGEFEQKEGILEDMLYKDAKANVSYVTDEKSPHFKESKKAVLEYKEVSPGSLEIKLITGRHHQIRVQLAHAGHPLLGDTKYGSDESGEESAKRGIKELKLKAYKLHINHPRTGEGMEFQT
ncbi:MAG: RluA family pseudouridine synthase [Lachnospiraceae bacterium]|nr:RluA family pseudouridine synthase [Lachnospiraceae bacterium]